MLIDQNEIDTLLAQADDLSQEAAVHPDQAAPPAPRRAPTGPVAHDVERILRVRVPAIVRLAHRPMPVRRLRKLAPGSILEFEKSVDDPLELMINNRPIGCGTCVKVGEHFGIRLIRVADARQRIECMGP